jgi:hypothetical protein
MAKLFAAFSDQTHYESFSQKNSTMSNRIVLSTNLINIELVSVAAFLVFG